MGHRALLAYRRDGGYDLHRSQWGGADFALARHVGPASPFAADTPFAVDPDPVATELSLETAVADHLDFLHHEAFYRVDADLDATPFHVLWFGLELDSNGVERSETVGHGAVVEARLRGDCFGERFRGARAVVGDAVDRGGFAPGEATDYLRERVVEWAGDREVILP